MKKINILNVIFVSIPIIFIVTYKNILNLLMKS